MEFRPLYFQRDSKIDVKLVGSQPDGDQMYTWKELCQEHDDTIVTCIGLLQFQNPKLLKFFSLLGEIEIIQASLSESGRYVAFIVCTSGVLDDRQNVEVNGIYQAYLAAVSSEPQDVKNCQAVTSCHNFLINCHFLHSLQQNEAKNFTEESPQTEVFIVLIHQHSIQVHKFSEESRSENLICITESKVLALEFLWCQWIPQHQCLFFLKYIDGMDSAIRSIQDLSYTVLCWIQFYNREEYELMMEIPASCLNLCGQYTMQRQLIYMNAINKISEGRLNLHVITSSQGEIFVCHQHFEPEYVDMEECLSSRSSAKSSSDSTDSSSFYTASSSHSGIDSAKSYDRESFYSTATKALSINENSFCESEVCSTLPVTENEIIHSKIDHCYQNTIESHRTKYFMEDDALYHIIVLHSCRKISVFRDKLHSLKHNTLYFFFVGGGSVITWCPGQFAHLLDTKFCYGPNYCVIELNDDNSLLNYITLKCKVALQTSQLSTGQCLLFVPGIPSIFTVHINIEQLANEVSSSKFSSPLASSLDKELGLIHYLSFHSNNAETLFQIMRAISKNPFDPQITDIFKELLLGSALAGVEYESYWKKHLTQYLTFFVLSAFASKLRRNVVQVGLQHEGRYIGEHVVYKELSVVSIIKAINIMLPVQCNLWNNFCYELKMEFATRMGKNDHFFFLRHAMGHNRMHTSQKRSIVNGIKQFLTCKNAENFQLGEAVDFLLPSKNYCSCVGSFQEGRTKMLDALCSELKKKFPQEKPSDIHKVIESYKSHKEIQLYKLICLTFKLFEIRYDSETIDLSLLDSSKQEMLCLFAMLQHLHLASEQLLLSLPSRFHTVQAIIGFKCLSFSTFMQYVYRKMIILCNASVEYLLKCEDESKAGIHKKKILICSLPREQAIPLLEKWNYCWNVKYHASNLNPIPQND